MHDERHAVAGGAQGVDVYAVEVDVAVLLEVVDVEDVHDLRCGVVVRVKAATLLYLVEVLVVGQLAEMVGFGAEKHVVVASHDVVGRAVDLEEAVEAEEGDEETAVAANGEATDEVDPDDPVTVGEEHGDTCADGLELAEEKERYEIEENAVDEDVAVVAHLAQLVEVGEDEKTRQQSFEVADG